MSENTPIMKDIRQSTSRNFQRTIDIFHMYSAIKVYRIIGIFILIALLIPSASATITQWQITPENPVMGDVVAVTGLASPSEAINARASFTDTVTPSLKDGKMRYEYLIKHVKIPDGDNKFTVNANGVKDINIKVQLYEIPIWTPSLGNDGNAGKATISQSNVPGGTHNIKIYGIAADGASAVTLNIIAQQPITADSSGKFEYNYDSSSMSGITAGTQLSVTMNNKGPISDTTAPSLSIIYPIDGANVTASPITISGTASDNVAIKNIKVNSITATGTTSWSVKVPLTEGSNTITAIATDTSGNTATKTITVTYTPTATDVTAVITPNDTTNISINSTVDENVENGTRNISSESLKKDEVNNTAVTPAKSNQTQSKTSSPEKPTTSTKVASAKYISVTIVAIFGFIYIMKRKI